MGSRPHTTTESTTQEQPPTVRLNPLHPLADGLRITVDTPPPPTLLTAEYELVRLLGRGGMGIVYLARQRKLNRLVAFKALTHFSSLDPEALERFQLEAHVLAKLHHPNIVQVYDAGTTHGTPYLAMEYVSGGSLAEQPATPEDSYTTAAQLVAQVAGAVGYAHTLGIIHRDIKPANILLTDDGQPKIADFGLAREIGAEHLTRTGQIAGTPIYMPPEQLTGQKDLSPAVDVWALGVVLYERLTGRLPFLGGEPQQLLNGIYRSDPPAPRTIRPDLPRDLETICLKCLNKDPAERYRTAGELADDLHRFLSNRSILARPARSWERGWRWCRRNPVVAGLTLGIMILLVGGSIGSLRLARWAMDERRQAVAKAQGEAELRKNAETAAEILEGVIGKISVHRESFGDLRKTITDASARIPQVVDNPLTQARLLSALGEASWALCDVPAAVRPLEQAYALRIEHLGPDHPDTTKIGNRLAYLYTHVDRSDDAIRIHRALLDPPGRPVQPADSMERLEKLFALNIALMGAGRHEDADLLGDELVAMSTRLTGPDSVDTMWYRLNCPRNSLRTKRYAELIPLYDQAHTLFAQRLPDNNVWRRWTQSELARAHFHSNRPAAARPLFRDLLDWHLRHAGQSHTHTHVQSKWLAACNEQLGRWGEAAALWMWLHDVLMKDAAIGQAEAIRPQLARAVAQAVWNQPIIAGPK